MSRGCQKTIFQYVNMSVCQYVRMQLFSLVIKIKVVQNVKTISENIILVCQYVNMSVWERERERERERAEQSGRERKRAGESERVRVRKPIRTAKEPALVYFWQRFGETFFKSFYWDNDKTRWKHWTCLKLFFYLRKIRYRDGVWFWRDVAAKKFLSDCDTGTQ